MKNYRFIMKIMFLIQKIQCKLKNYQFNDKIMFLIRKNISLI